MNSKQQKVEKALIKNLNDTLPEIKSIIENYYDLGNVVDLRKLDIGETNFNYYVTLEKGGIKQKYFAQLFSSVKTLEKLEYELNLRQYFMSRDNIILKCALHVNTKNGCFAVECQCTQNGHVRYLCVFDFIEGTTYDYEQWAFGKMNDTMIRGMARGIAYYHISGSGYVPSVECENVMPSYEEEIADYHRVFTDEFKKQLELDGENGYYVWFKERQPWIIDLLDKYTDHYLEEKNRLCHCICHIDSGANNYIFGNGFQPVAVCDMDWSHIMPRVFDLCWLVGEGMFEYDSKTEKAVVDIENIAVLLDAYDEVMEEQGAKMPGRLTEIERYMLPEIFQLVAMRLGLYNIWTYILTGNPTDSLDYNMFWGKFAVAEMEFVEANIEKIRDRICK